MLGWYEWDFTAADEQLRRAVALSPSYAEAHWSFGSILPAIGLLHEAIDEMRKAVTLDPLVHRSSRWLARFLLYAGDLDASIAQSHKTLELKEDNFISCLDIGSAYLAKHDYERALEWYQRGQRFENSVRSYDALIVRALVPLGRRDEAEAILARLEEESRRHYVRAEILAMGHAALGDVDSAFACLERAFRARSGGLIYLHLDPGYHPLRGDRRFDELVARIKLK